MPSLRDWPPSSVRPRASDTARCWDGASQQRYTDKLDSGPPAHPLCSDAPPRSACAPCRTVRGCKRARSDQSNGPPPAPGMRRSPRVQRQGSPSPGAACLSHPEPSPQPRSHAPRLYHETGRAATKPVAFFLTKLTMTFQHLPLNLLHKASNLLPWVSRGAVAKKHPANCAGFSWTSRPIQLPQY